MKTILVDAWNTLVTSEWIFLDMQKLLDSYPNKKVVLTSANDEQIITLGLTSLPYELFTLKHNPEKTDPRYYEILMDTFGWTPEDIIYFEHNPEAVKSAESMGIKTHHYNKDAKNLKVLKEFIDANL